MKQRMSDNQYIHGMFKEEIKNRFLCTVTIDGSDVLCYIPSSCRLSNFLDMPGREVLLAPVASSTARTRYSVYAVKVGRRFIPINLSNINVVIYRELHRRFFAFLGKRKNVKKEALVNGYKSDLFIEDSQTIIEIKCILSFDDKALFPTVFSERAINQLKQISTLLEDGYKVCYLFISLNPSVKRIFINPSIDQYYQMFSNCLEKGMQVRGFSVGFDKDEIHVKSSINVSLRMEPEE